MKSAAKKPFLTLFLGVSICVGLGTYATQSRAQLEQRPITTLELGSDLASDLNAYDPISAQENNNLNVQAVLTAKETVVIASPIDGVLKTLPFKSGDLFKKGDIIAQYQCRFEHARLHEVRAQLRINKRQKEAYERLKKKDAVSDVEYVATLQEYERAKAVMNQVQSQYDLCTIRAPFDGRINDLAANNHEAVRAGRVIMEVSSTTPLQAELLVPSIWLRWLNIGTPLDIKIHETGQTYGANLVRIHGKVDPVTQTAHVIAELNQYEEKLLPGMSGRAMFNEDNTKDDSTGFLGIKIIDENTTSPLSEESDHLSHLDSIKDLINSKSNIYTQESKGVSDKHKPFPILPPTKPKIISD